MEVGKVGAVKQGREQTHRGLQFRIGHQRQVDQTLDRVPSQVAPDRIVFRLDLFLGRVCREVNAEQSQARKRAVDALRVLGPRDMQLDLQVVDGYLADFGRAAPQ